MKFTIEIDATPKEVRESLGLPDIQAAQDRVVAKVEERVMDFVDDYDPTKLVKMLIPDGLGFLEGMQKTIFANIPKGSKSSKKTP